MLGEKIQQLRKEKGLSQEQLAAQLTISRQAISKWELGESMPDTENIVQLSKLFGVTTDFLLNDDINALGDKAEMPTENQRSVDTFVPKQGLPPQKIIGLVLMGIGIIAFLVIAVLAGFLTALIFSLPLIACAVVCLTVKAHFVLWLLWTIYLLIHAAFAFVTGHGFLWIFSVLKYPRTSLFAWVMMLGLVILAVVTGRLIYIRRKVGDKKS